MKTAKTQLSKELAKIRIDYEITRAQMAKDLKMSDKELASIEAGKSEITYSFLKSVAERYSQEDEVGESLLEALQLAFMKSATAITFKLSELDDHQRMRVLELQSQIEAENAYANAQAEEEKRRQREQRAAERLAKKEANKTKVLSEGVVSEKGVEETDESVTSVEEAQPASVQAELSDDDLNVLNSLDKEYGSLIDELDAA